MAISTRPPLVVSIADPSVFDKLVEINALSFAKDPLRLAAFSGIPDADYAKWTMDNMVYGKSPPGMKAVFLQAVKPDTGDIVGWARWLCPIKEGEAEEKEEREIPMLEGMDEVGFAKHKNRNKTVCAELLGERKRYSKSETSHLSTSDDADQLLESSELLGYIAKVPAHRGRYGSNAVGMRKGRRRWSSHFRVWIAPRCANVREVRVRGEGLVRHPVPEDRDGGLADKHGPGAEETG
jgi:hypothetical protein